MPKESRPPKRVNISRRRFAKTLAASAAMAAMPAGSLARPASEIAVQTPASQKASPTVEWQMQAILSKQGLQLSDEQKSDIKRLLTQAEKTSDALRAFPLDNSNQPATIFRVYRNKKG